MTTITRRFEFDAAHRVLGHEGKCRFLHGHRYIAEVTASALELDKLGMVIDFSVLKTMIGTWIDCTWDHNILLNDKDPLFQHLVDTEERTPSTFEGNPTAENIAKYLYHKANDLMVDCLIKVTHVRIFETPNCWADYP